MEDYLLIIDGSSLLTTQFYGNLPREILFAKETSEKEKYFYKIMMTSKGVYTNAVYGFLRTLFKIIKDQKPSHLAICWDLTRDTFRRKLYPEYKANRSETLKPLSDQFALMQEICNHIGIPQFMSNDYEADDFCGSLCQKFEQEIPVRIFTKDHDYLQLVTENTYMWLMHSSLEQTDKMYEKYHLSHPDTVPERAFELNPELVLKEFGILPENVNSLKGIEGDPSDNIKGVLGVGHETAVKLIHEYHTVSELYRVIHEAEKEGPEGLDSLKKAWKEKLSLNRSPLTYLLKESDTELVGEKAAFLSEMLATIKKDIDLSNVTLDHLRLNLHREELLKELDTLEFKSLNTDFLEPEQEEKPFSDICREITDFNETENLLKSVSKNQKVALTFLPGIGLSFMKEEGNVFLIRELFFVTSDILKEFCLKLAERTDNLITFDGKSLYKLTGLTVSDASLMAYLLNPVDNDYSVKTIAAKFLNFHQNVSPEQEIYLSSFVAFQAKERLEQALQESGMLSLYLETELPLQGILAEMEITGIQVQKNALQEYSSVLQEKLSLLEQEIYSMSGTAFNINSPKQLGEVLFDQLKLPYGKKTKSGYSTSAEILEELKEEYPIVQKILDYRMFSKLRSTYAEGLQEYIREDNRIHCHFNQTVTATGRISSDSPNLQNIPMRTEEGRLIRKVFVPKPGCVFIDADYSQIELRVLAHLSGDENLLNAYRLGRDIHAHTASLIFKVPLESVTPEMRRKAKIVNFGIIYGMSAFSLSKDLGVSRKEAEAFMETYFASYPAIQTYLKDQVAYGYDHGFVKTCFNRIRPIPELSSSNFNQRSFGERAAMNSPIQGAAADIMKFAMIAVRKALKKASLQSKIVLQVHDELVIEAYKNEADEVEKLLTQAMENCVKLNVPLKAEAKRGNSLYESK